jgi:hypothetical protein
LTKIWHLKSVTVVRKAKRNYLNIILMLKKKGMHLNFELERLWRDLMEVSKEFEL